VRETSIDDQPQRSTPAREPSRRQVLDQITEQNPDSLPITDRRRNSGDISGDEDRQMSDDKPASATELMTKQVLTNPPCKHTRKYSNASL